MAPSAQADSDAWHAAVRKGQEKWQVVVREEIDARSQVRILEGKLKVQEEQAALLQSRLDALNKQLSPSSPQPEAMPSAVDPARKQREEALIAASADRMVIIAGKDGPLGAGFLCQQAGGTRVFTSAPLVSGNREISIMALDGSTLPISKELGCPEGVDLVCLHPAASLLSAFELAATDELPNVGDRVLVILADQETRKLTGVSGAIRGIGPDTWELDADLLTGMNGAPVLSLESGKVIGIVTPQVAGNSADWAHGTRHEATRSFAARLDRVGKWQTVDLDRFAKEADYVKRINDRTRLVWAAHLLIDFEVAWRRIEEPAPPRFREEEDAYREKLEKYKDEVRSARKNDLMDPVLEFARLHSSNMHLQRAESWLADLRKANQLRSGDELDRRLSNVYREMRTDLEQKERNLSEHLTWYQAKQHQAALEWRRQALRTVAGNGDRLGR